MTATIRVLHVEDDDSFAELTSASLRRENDRMLVETAADADEGLERLAAEQFDCVVSDYEMPGMDGVEFLRAVRERHPDLPFILFTAKGSEEVASEALSAGATDYLQKGSTDRYTLLANRIRNGVEQYREKQHRAALERARTIVSDVNQTLVHADAREDAQQRVCEILADTSPYRFAAFSDAGEGAADLRNWAGTGKPFFDAVDLRRLERTGGASPECHTDHTGELTVSRNVQSADRYEAWHDLASAHGIQSLAVVPLSYEGTSYGLLTVFAGRAEAFDAAEREMLADLGDDISHALASLDTREALESEKERFRLLAESAMDAIVTIDGENVVQFANPAVEEVFGYSPDELVGESLTKLIPEPYRERHRAAVARYLETGERTSDWSSIELPGLRKDGEVIDLSVSFSAFEDGDEIRFEGVIRDVSERKSRERELQRYETITGTMRDGICVMNRDSEFVMVNDALTELTGYDRERLLGSHASMVRPAALDDRFEEIQAALDGGSDVESVQIKIETADGGTRVVEGRYVEFSGEESGRLGVWRDVTEKREREQRLELYREYTERMLDAIDDVFFVFDREGRLQRWNTAFSEVTGYTDAELEGMEVLEFIPKSDTQETRAAIEEVFETGTGRLEAAILPKDGEPIPYEYASDRVEHPDGGPRLVGIGRDISERKRQQEALERQNERLNEFADIVSHDLRNPLSIADGRIELAQEECDTDHLEPAKTAIERSQALIEDLLTLARKGQQVGDTEQVELEAVATDSWRNVPTPDASRTIDARRTVRAHPSRLEQLFENLFRNVVEHGSTSSQTQSDDVVEHGGDSVTVTVGDLEDGFFVADDGPGIPEADREQVFEAGYTTASEGTGYGLSIVEQIAEAHGWDARVTESERGGARFEFTGVETE